MPENDLGRPYVDFEYYRNTFHGTAFDEMGFQNAEIEAEALIDAITFGRIPRLKEIPDCVKRAICSAADAMQDYLSSRETNVKSESNDGYSVTYTDAVNDKDCQDSMILRAKRHLANTGLTYRGYSQQYDQQEAY